MGLALVAGVAGCGGSDDNSAQKFIGTWMYAAGSTVTVTCSGAQPQVYPLTGNLTIAAGLNADEIAITTSACTLKLAVAGSMATLASAGQMCNGQSQDQNGNPVSVTINYGSGSLSTTDGKTLTESLMGGITASGSSTTCSYSASASATKVSQ